MDVPVQDSVITIDCQYLGQAKRAAAYLLMEGDRATFIDNNTRHALPLLMDALREQGMTPEQVEYVIVTHIHLDHAGGTGALMEACPNATLLLHPRAVRHMADPSRLTAGVKAVYGEEFFERVYGQLDPIEEDRMRVPADGESIAWGSRQLTFTYIRGHANHHFVIHDSATRALFAGDAFGIGCVGPHRHESPYTLCAAAPADFDANEARLSVEKILAQRPAVVYQTHFGPVTNLSAAAASLLDHIDRMEAILIEVIPLDLTGEALVEHCERRVLEESLAHRQKFKVARGVSNQADSSCYIEWFKGDFRLNAMGIACVAEKQRQRIYA